MQEAFTHGENQLVQFKKFKLKSTSTLGEQFIPTMKKRLTHKAHCEGYEDLKEDADLTNEEELVQFFTRVIERRHKMNWDLVVLGPLYSSTAGTLEQPDSCFCTIV